MKKVICFLGLVLVLAVAKAQLGNVSFLATLKPAAAGGGGISDWSDIANLYAVWDANLLVTNTAGSIAANDDTVKSWGDSSGNQHHVYTNATQGVVCKFSTSMGTNHGLTMGRMIGGFTAIPNTTILVAAKVTGIGANTIAMTSSNASAIQAIYKDGSDLPTIYSGSTIAGGTALVINNNYTFIATFNSSGNDTLYTNGVQAATGDSGNQSLDGVMIGNHQSSDLPWGDFIGLVVIYNRILNSTEIGQIDALAVARGWR